MKLSALTRTTGSQKKFLGVAVGVLVCALIYSYGAVPLIETQKRAEEEIDLKKKVLLKYDDYLANRQVIAQGLESARQQYEAMQKRLLPGETPQLAAANLQDIVRRVTEKNGMSMRSFRILESKEGGLYRKISLQIELNPVNRMLSLTQMIQDVETHEKDLVISEMDLLIFNPRMPTQIQGSLVISGFTKGAKGREKGKEA